MASTTSLPVNRAGSRAGNLWSGIDNTTMSAVRTASAAQRASTPGITTCVMSSRFSGLPEVAITTSNPASSAILAMTGPTWPAPRTAMRRTDDGTTAPLTFEGPQPGQRGTGGGGAAEIAGCWLAP